MMTMTIVPAMTSARPRTAAKSQTPAATVVDSTARAGHGSLRQSTYLAAPLTPVKVNHETDGAGFVGAEIEGNSLHLTILTTGLLDNAPHGLQIDVDGTGRCPGPDAAADLHGHKAIGLTQTLPHVGLPGAALTISGSTNPVYALDLDRYPAAGTFQYQRTIPITEDLRRNLDSGHAVVLVLGVDYDGDGRYNGVLSYERLAPALPTEATAPALCGVLG